jgi:hypothetical protein
MKSLTIDAVDFHEFCQQIRLASPDISVDKFHSDKGWINVHRDGHGFLAHYRHPKTGERGTEVRITPEMSSLSEWNLFFHGQNPGFKGTVNIPEAKDYGIEEPLPKSEVPPEASKATENPPQASASPGEPVNSQTSVEGVEKPKESISL